MKNAVIYARFSSDKQTEQSIEGQLYDCYNYAKHNDLRIVGEYIDRALSGRTDDRPQFQKMISDSANGAWEYILVWKFDRFSRDKYDNAHYKHILKKNGIRVISAMERIPDGAEGVILESLLEGLAEYYSVELKEKINRGMRQSAMKGQTTGHAPYGYKTDPSTKKYVINESERYVPETIFRRYLSGDKVADIVRDINDRGYRTRKNAKFTANTIYHILANETYTGKYKYSDIVIEGGVPQMIPEEDFKAVRKKLAENKKKRAKFAAKADYILSGKVFCGHCGESMCGFSGKSHTGDTHYYYRCNGVHKRNGCKKKHERKADLENIVCAAAQKAFLDMDKKAMAERLHEMYVKSVSGQSIAIISKEITAVKKQVDNLIGAVAESGGNKFLYQRLSELTERLEQLEMEKCIQERMTDNVPSVDQLLQIIDDILSVDINTPEGRKTLIDVLVDKVYVYDDKITIVYKDSDGSSKDIPFSEITALEKGYKVSTNLQQDDQKQIILTFASSHLICMAKR